VLGLLGGGAVWAMDASRDGVGRISDGGDHFPGMHEDFAALFERVQATNKDVDDLTGSGWQARTVVHIASYTAANDNPHVVQDSVLKELRGIVLAQELLVQEARTDTRKVLLRLLLADAGPRFEAGGEVARDIKALIPEKGVIGVIGLGQSRAGTYATMRELDDASLVMIGTTATADDMPSHARHYYQVAPDNQRQAEIAVSFLRHHPTVSPDGGDRVPAEGAIVAYDPEDDYSRNLAEGFSEKFTAEFGGTVEEEEYEPQDPRNQETEWHPPGLRRRPFSRTSSASW
jgi:hypothetical protein